MASTPSSSDNVRKYEFQLHSKGKPIGSKAKVIIMNVFHKLKEHHPLMTHTELVSLSANLTGISAASVIRIQHEFQKNGGFSTPGKKRPSRVGKSTRMQKYDDFTLSCIRRKVHQFYKRNELPTAAKVMKAVNNDDDLPSFSVRTIRRLMNDLGFVFRKRNRHSILIEREDIQMWRRNYLRKIRSYRSEKRTIYYTDETWVNFGHTKSAVWKDTTIRTPKQAFLAGLTTGLTAPTGKGARLIVTHAGSDKGFIPQACEIFKAKKDTGDYHSEMNGVHYEEWFVKKLLPFLDPKSIIVMDNASYHSVRKESIPTQSSRKAAIQTWLTEKNITWAEDMVKVELLQLVSKVRTQYESYKIDELAEQFGHTVLRLPPYHCELNPIELIWAQVKNYVAAENKTFKEDEVTQITEEAIKKVTPENWENCVKHVMSEESVMWELDGLTDTTVDKLQFNVDPESTDTASDSELSGIDMLTP